MQPTPQPHPSQEPGPGPGPKDPVPSIAERYAFPEPVVRRLFESMKGSGGRQCQFDAPELGGMGQWSPGMVMTAGPSDHDLRVRIDGLCCELAAVLQGSNTAAPEALAHGQGAQAVGLPGVRAGESWWPASFGSPAASGEQCGVRYAYFPNVHRLLVQKGAHVEAYDTGAYAITGIAQQQGQSSSITFNSSRGPVHLDQLRCVPLA